MLVVEEEQEEWKPFRNALDKKDRKRFDEMWELPKFYISACSNSVQYVRLHPILMSILLYHYKPLTQCISGVERIEAKVSSKKRRGLMIKEEQEVPTTTVTLDGYFIHNNANFK